MHILIPILAVMAIGLICGAGLSIASSVMKVEEDERFPAIRECLPGANCGACGFSGCDGYAHALIEKPGTKANLCVPGADAVAEKLSAILGVEAEDVIEHVAVIRCDGTCDVTSANHTYHGISSCKAAKLFFGGGGSCTFGCIGLGDCARACPNDAIIFKRGIARINADMCMGCGLCAKACPQQIIELLPDIAKVAVMCSNKDKGSITRKNCLMGCTGCKRCEKNCKQGAITVTDNLARIDYSKCTGCRECLEICPSGCLREQDFTGIHRKS